MSDIYEVVDVVQGSKEWLEWRKTGVTATCSPILLEEAGATKTPYELYLQYAGLIKAEDLSVIKQVDAGGNDSNLLIVFYVQIMPDDLVMQLHRF
ncbi:TPA: hypothetical protein ACN5P3_004235 [Citrobacter freundii]